MNINDDVLYHDKVITFLKEAAAFCELLEKAGDSKRVEWFEALRSTLSKMYVSGLALPQVESCFDESNQKFVTEAEYNTIRHALALKAGRWDEYPEVFDPQEPIVELQITASVSEDLADIYQDIKDFLTLYHLGNHEVMNDALWEVKMNFERYWGQKLLNVLRVIHRIITFGDVTDEEEEEQESSGPESRDTSDWIITKRQQDFRADGNKRLPDDK